MTLPVCKGCGKPIRSEPARDTAGVWHVRCLEDHVAGHEADERAVDVREQDA